MRRLLLALAITAGATGVAMVPAGAGEIQPTVAGVVACNADGSATITWTFSTTVIPVLIDNPNVAVSGAVSGGATFDPDSLFEPPQSATATTPVPAGVSGQVIITVPWETKGPGGTETAAVNVACTTPAADAVATTPRTVG
jgi:hypothetical protein